MLRLRGFIACGATVIVALLLGPASFGAQSSASDVTITVTARDYAFKLSKKTAFAGKVMFDVKNTGKHDHDFKVGGKKTPVLKPGKSAMLVVTFAKAGSFSYSSTVAGDAGKGMKGTFTTTAPVTTGADVAAGKTVFQTTGCGACHVLKAAAATGTIASSLDKSKSSLTAIKVIVASGKDAMQAYSTLLTPKQIDDVSAFVFQSRTG